MHLAQARAEGAVVDAVADTRDHTREELGLFGDVELDLVAGHLLELHPEALEVGSAKRLGRGDLRTNHAALLVRKDTKLADDGRERAETAPIGQEVKGVLRRGAERQPLGHFVQNALFGDVRNEWVLEGSAKLRGRLVRGGGAGQLAHELGELILLFPEVEKGLCVALGYGCGNHHAAPPAVLDALGALDLVPSSARNSSARRSWSAWVTAPRNSASALATA